MTANDNRKLVTSRLLVLNKDFSDIDTRKHWVINYNSVNAFDVLAWALQYLRMLKTSLAKVLVYCNPSFADEETNQNSNYNASPYTLVDMQFTIRYNPALDVPADGGSAASNSAGGGWEVQIDVPRTHPNMQLSANMGKRNVIISKKKSPHAFRYLYVVSSVNKIMNIIRKNGKLITQVELHKKGVKVSDNKEMITLFYNP